ncbi:DUF2087 domain-containing protein [Streptomyces sp. NBC_01306]|uniref:DUF2087 domain-containing protein n=1 Tax=Streptomyces sp. NBC_01306 TaxID=2903819 RepID=UPI0022513921|nr:DUF2087 domain-containing protein [Streptomyces sp. NBC_01306]MCX4725045.1 DUF2087 domain-containing protein [Streptomyces sp. NBC_01306]
MTPESVIGLLAEPMRLRVFSAVALGAATLPEIVETAGASPKEAAAALRRLTDGGLVEETSDGLRSRHEEFKEIARAARPERSSEEYGSGDERTEALLRTFVRDGRLVRLPAQFRRREVLLRYFVERSFDPGVTYPEKAVNDKLREWCKGAEIDHVTIRRYLIDLCLLGREDNHYWLREDVKPTV